MGKLRCIRKKKITSETVEHENKSCSPEPIVDIGYVDEVITIPKNSQILLGTPGLVGHRYRWSAVPDFENGTKPTTPRLLYKPIVTKKLTLHAVTKCGEAAESITVIIK